MHTDHGSSSPILLTTVYIMFILFFLKFPDFLVIFLLIAMLGNVHTACKQCTNIVNNDLHLSLYFFLIFSDFLSIFTVITILGNAHRPCKLHLNIINKYTLCLSIFSWPLFYFLIILGLMTILGSVHRPCEEYPNIITTIPMFFWFYYYFSCENAKLSIFGIFSSIMVTGFQCQSSDWTVGTILWQKLHHLYSFAPDFSAFFHYICINYHIRKCAQTM